jgi:cytoskeletal protein CcmA (bactofilin family)
MPEPEPSETPDDKVRCPHCRTTRLRVLNKLDRIETLYGNSLMNRIRARRGDTIYHCVYCRLQFYDPRKPGRPQTDATAKSQAQKPAAPEKTEPEPVKMFAAVAAAGAGAVAVSVALRPQPAPPPPVAPIRPPLPSTPTNFSPGVTVHGSIQTAEDIYVDCRFEGTLTSQTHRITLGPNAKVKATVRAPELEVFGTLHGNSNIAGRMTLRPGSKVLGDIKSCDIVIDDGAHFKGSVDLVRQQPRLPLA